MNIELNNTEIQRLIKGILNCAVDDELPHISPIDCAVIRHILDTDQLSISTDMAVVDKVIRDMISAARAIAQTYDHSPNKRICMIKDLRQHNPELSLLVAKVLIDAIVPAVFTRESRSGWCPTCGHVK